VVAANSVHEEASLLRELVGDQEAPAEEEIDLGDSGSELTELEGRGGEGGGDREAGVQVRRPQEFFRRNGNRSVHGGGSDDDVFATPSNMVMRGALSDLSATATSSLQQVATARTLKLVKTLERGLEWREARGGGNGGGGGRLGGGGGQSGRRRDGGCGGPRYPDTNTHPSHVGECDSGTNPGPSHTDQGEKEDGGRHPEANQTLPAGAADASGVGFAVASARSRSWQP